MASPLLHTVSMSDVTCEVVTVTWRHHFFVLSDVTCRKVVTVTWRHDFFILSDVTCREVGYGYRAS